MRRASNVPRKMEPRIIQYNAPFLRNCLIILSVFLLGSPIFVFIAANSTRPLYTMAAVLCLVATVVVFPIAIIHLGHKLITKEPALGIYETGLANGLLILEKPSLLKWEEIACVYEKSGHICILPVDIDDYYKARPWIIRWIYLPSLISYGTMLEFAPAGVDIGWDEFSNLVSKHTKIGTVVEGGIKVQEEKKEGFEEVSKEDREISKADEEAMERVFEAIKNRLTLNGKLKTVEEYRTHFTRDLIGVWSSDIGMPSPIDKTIVFYEDGRGYVEGAFFTSYSGEFEWRSVGDKMIDVCSVDESPKWYRLQWWFAEPKGTQEDRPQLYLHEIEDREDPDEPYRQSELISSILMDPLTFSGLPKKRRD